MNLTVKQVSSLEKIRPGTIENVREFIRKTVMRGQFFSYQIAVSSPNSTQITLAIDSALKNHITVYHVKNVIMDLAAFEGSDEDYLEKKPAVMPDLLPARSRTWATGSSACPPTATEYWACRCTSTI